MPQQKVYVVMDRICEGDIVIAVFSTKDLADAWIKAHKDDPYPALRCKRYESLDIEESEFNPVP